MSRWKVLLPMVVLAVLLIAGGVFGVRTVLGGDDAGATSASGDRGTRSPSATTETTPAPTVTPTPTASGTPTPRPTPTRTTPSSGATPAPTAGRPPRTTRSTAAVSAQIKASLDTQGRPTRVSCPATVPAAVGTTFSCSVAYSDTPGVVVADASVRTTSASGTFTWRSVPRG